MCWYILNGDILNVVSNKKLYSISGLVGKLILGSKRIGFLKFKKCIIKKMI